MCSGMLRKCFGILSSRTVFPTSDEVGWRLLRLMMLTMNPIKLQLYQQLQLPGWGCRFTLSFSSSPPPPSHLSICHCLTLSPFLTHHLDNADLLGPSEGSASVASPGVDLFMMTVESPNQPGSLEACFSSVAPQLSPSPSPLFAAGSCTIITTAAISAPLTPRVNNPSTDLFCGKAHRCVCFLIFN